MTFGLLSTIAGAMAILSILVSAENNVSHPHSSYSMSNATASSSHLRMLDAKATSAARETLALFPFNDFFPEAVSLYSYDNLLKASDSFSDFLTEGTPEIRKQEMSAFFASLAHESGNFKFAEEEASREPNFNIDEYCSEVSGCNGISYHGRGPIQLSWNYNYRAAGEALGVDLYNNPDLVSTDSLVAWKTAIWFWTKKDNDVFSIHSLLVDNDEGFAATTFLINGGLECGENPENKKSEVNRIELYSKYVKYLNVPKQEPVSCQTAGYGKSGFGGSFLIANNRCGNDWLTAKDNCGSINCKVDTDCQPNGGYCFDFANDTTCDIDKATETPVETTHLSENKFNQFKNWVSSIIKHHTTNFNNKMSEGKKWFQSMME